MPHPKASVTYNAASLDAMIVAVYTGICLATGLQLYLEFQGQHFKTSGRTPVEMKKGLKPYLTEPFEERIED